MKNEYTPIKLPNYLINQMDKVINKEPKMFSSRPDFIKFLVKSYLHNNGENCGGKMDLIGGGDAGGIDDESLEGIKGYAESLVTGLFKKSGEQGRSVDEGTSDKTKEKGKIVDGDGEDEAQAL